MKILAQNKDALSSYQPGEKYEAGLVLFGSEVKSVKSGRVNLKGSYVSWRPSQGKAIPELFLINCHIAPYQPAADSQKNYQPTRERKLLLRRQEIKNLQGKLTQKGLTIVPTKIYTKKRLIKIEIVLARGKTKQDKRQQIKKREVDRQLQRALKTSLRR